MSVIHQLWWLCLILVLSPVYATVETIELVHNGDFEAQHELWREQTSSWQRRDSKQAAVSDLYYHTIRYSLRTNNGSIWQIIPLEPGLSNLNLSFWLYLQSVPDFPKGRTIAGMDIWIHSGSTKKAIAYYVFGDYRYQRENVKDLFIPDLQRDRWNYITRNLEKDLQEAYPDVNINDIQKINLTLWAFQSPEPIPYWDDISIKSQRESLKQTPWTSSSTQTAPSTSLTSFTPTLTQPEQPDQSGIWPYMILVIVVIIVGTIFVLKRRQTNK